MSPLLETLAQALERPRELSPQVIDHLAGTHGTETPALGPFLEEKLPVLEDYEVDLALSPLFTPTLREQAPFAVLLGGEPVPRDQWPALIQELLARPTRIQLITPDGRTHAVPARAVTLERFVHRLRLDGHVPAALVQRIRRLPPPTDPALLLAIARRAIWESAPRRRILEAFLAFAPGPDATWLDDATSLLNVMETYEPADLAELLARIPGWERTLQQQIEEANRPKSFFNERVEEMHGGGRDQRRADVARILAKQAELASLSRLREVLRAANP
ncbi:MAG TPA: hypothetical protein VNO52_08210 [Methylomirabilota bacterium]|nr:hypothetical protein [Methylomirabilota bacterium]